MTTAAVQTLWAELLAATLADAGVMTVVISPGSRSTPLVAALATIDRLELVTIIDERAAAFFALGAARATGRPTAIVCTSGTAAAHYLPAVVEASLAGIPLIAITADRPPELLGCGASQTIDQVKLYGDFVRGAFDLGAPVGTALALRAVRRKVVQAVALARGPHPGPVHLEVPLRKPLEPAAPSTDAERALARLVAELTTASDAAPPKLVADPGSLAALAAAIAREPRGVIVVGAMPVDFAASRDAVFALAARAGYPVIAEAGSQLRFGACGEATVIDHVDVIAIEQRPIPRLVIQLGAEPVAASWPAWLAAFGDAERWVCSATTWQDPDSSARGVVIGELATTLQSLAAGPPRAQALAWLADWRALESRAAAAVDEALVAHPQSESAVLRAAIAAAPPATAIQIGNSLPIRVVDQVAVRGTTARCVLTQRGAAGIDGMIASAAGATRGGQPVLLVLGDVSFAHDLGGLLAARCASAPLVIVVLDNGGGQIFAGLPIGRAGLGDVLERHFLTAPDIDPAVVAIALGARAVTAPTPAAVASAIAAGLANPGTTVIHAPVSTSGAHDVRRMALELLVTATTATPLRVVKGGNS